MSSTIPLHADLRPIRSSAADRSIVYYCVLETRCAVEAGRDSANVIPYTVLEARDWSQTARTHAFSCTNRRFRIAFESERIHPKAFAFDLVRECYGAHAGTLSWEQLYQYVPAECEFSLLELVTHIHAAPLLTGQTSSLSDYVPSSYRAYRDFNTVPWLTMRRTLEFLDHDVKRARVLLDECLCAYIAEFRRRSRGFAPTADESLDRQFFRNRDPKAGSLPLQLS